MTTGSDDGRSAPHPRALFVLGALGAAAIGALAYVGRPADGGDDAEVRGEASTDPVGAEADGWEAPPELAAQRRDGEGEHVLEGQLVGGGGEPVAGAIVRAQSAWDARGGEPVVAISGAEGEFVLRGLDEGSYALRVEGEGVLAATVAVARVPGDAIRVLVSRRVEVAGRVVDRGEPVPGALVVVTGDGAPGGRTAEADRAGAFSFEGLPEGVYEVYAIAGERAARATRAPRLGPGPFDDVKLSLEPAAVVSGRVIDEATGAGISALVRLSSEEGEPARRAWSDADGRFRIEGVPPGRWTAEPSAPGYLAADSVSFEAGAGHEPTLRLLRGGIVEGRVVDDQGAPVEGVVISLAGKDGAGRTRTFDELGARRQLFGAAVALAPAVVGPDQRFEARGELGVVHGPIPYPPPPGEGALLVAIPDLTPDPDAEGDAPAVMPPPPELASRYVTDGAGRFRATGLDPGEYRVIARPASGAAAASDPVELGLGEIRRGVRVVLAAGVTITGRVVSTEGGALSGAQLVAEPALAGLPPTRARTDADGYYRLGPVRGQVDLSVNMFGHAPQTRALALGGRGPRERDESFRLVPADATFAGRVTGPGGMPLAGARVIISPEGVGEVVGVTDDFGRVEIAGLPRGEHAVHIVHDDLPPHRTRARTGEPASLRVPGGGGVAGRVVDAHSGGGIEAMISATGPSKAQRDTDSDASGDFTLPALEPGNWTLRVDLPGYVAQAVRVQVPGGAPPGGVSVRDVAVTLERGARIAGVVRDADGARVANATVSAGDRETRTDADGYFELDDVPSGDIAIRANKDGARGTERIALRPGDEIVTLDVRLGEPGDPG